jgi:hypothetical protein
MHDFQNKNVSCNLLAAFCCWIVALFSLLLRGHAAISPGWFSDESFLFYSLACFNPFLVFFSGVFRLFFFHSSFLRISF